LETISSQVFTNTLILLQNSSNGNKKMKNELSDREMETYSRQVVLADIGYDGQVKLRNARVCLIGVGGLGAPVALKLVGMGIGYLRIVDRDIVSRSDLHRQYLYDAQCVGQPKVEVAWRKLSRLNPDVEIDPVPESLNSINAEELITGMDIVIDGLDRPEPRYLVNRTCNRLNIPYVFGAAIEAFGNVSTLLPGQTFCLECFMPGLKDEDLPACGVVGVHPSILGIVSSIQVSEAARVIMGKQPKLFNKLLYIDLREFEFNILDIPALENCRVCGTQSAGAPEKVADRLFEEACARDGRRNFILSPNKRITIDLDKLEKFAKQSGLEVTTAGKFGVTFRKSEKITACMLKSGIMNAQTPPYVEEDDKIKDEIFDIYKSMLVDGLGLSEGLLPTIN
jgi:adenylyltransferase/sulfurtransferase